MSLSPTYSPSTLISPRRIDANPCPNAKKTSFSVPPRCDGICRKRRDEHYDFEHVGETVVERQRGIDKKWDAERKNRQLERKVKEEEARENAVKVEGYESGGGKRIKVEKDQEGENLKVYGVVKREFKVKEEEVDDDMLDEL